MLLYARIKHYYYKRKERVSPQGIGVISYKCVPHIKAFFSTSFQGSLTVEAALVLPLFLFFMIAAIQYAAALDAAVRYGAALSQTGKTMAAAAYAVQHEAGEGGAAAAALSGAYAHQKVVALAGKSKAVKNINMALSSFLQEDDRIDLVMTYQIRSPVGLVKLPGNFFLQRACVRAWTGRSESGGADREDREGEGKELVYVTQTGSVYHEDPNCTHLRLSIRRIDREAVDSLRNSGGEKYHACEKCGGGSGAGVYITNEGNRYHGSLSCSGLKRTVRQVDREECGLRACKKCGKR